MPTPDDKILSVDIGGSHIKAALLDMEGTILTEYERTVTPSPANPESVIACIETLANKIPGFTKISAGFPGNVRDGIVFTAPNLDNAAWQNIAFAKLLSEKLNAPARVVNDADMLGLGTVSGKGLEMMITLGTGFGTAFLKDGKLLPHFEIAHHPIAKKKTYDEYIGEKAFKKCGKKKWSKRVEKIIPLLKLVFNYDTLYIGGGNAENIRFTLPPDCRIATNLEGIHGGARLWDN